MERPLKRQRLSPDSLLPTPPASEWDAPAATTSIIDRATYVLKAQATALSHVKALYETSLSARESLTDAVEAVLQSQSRRGKLIVCGVGKSGYIGMKFTATCKSLGISASFLHACEALHGDLGDIKDNDVLLFITYSGKTPELLGLLPHIPSSVQTMAISAHNSKEACAVLSDSPDGILLPAPVHETEKETFGYSAPTTSTTVALAVADMLALTVADQLHKDDTKRVFDRNHPGGAIGMDQRRTAVSKEEVSDPAVLELPSPSILSRER